MIKAFFLGHNEAKRMVILAEDDTLTSQKVDKEFAMGKFHNRITLRKYPNSFIAGWGLSMVTSAIKNMIIK